MQRCWEVIDAQVCETVDSMNLEESESISSSSSSISFDDNSREID